MREYSQSPPQLPNQSKSHTSDRSQLGQRPIFDSSVNSSGFVLEDVEVEYSGIFALKSIQLSINQGEIVFITGPSGAGKTTLLNILSGKLNPTSGSVKLPIKNDLGKTFFTARVFQDLRLFEDLTLLENLQWSYDKFLYKNKKEFKEDLNELSRIFGIEDKLKLKINKANGGLKQKVAIIRALLAKPDAFIADEPTSSLDGDNAKKLFEVLNLYNSKRGMTVIWASHNKDLVKKFNGKIIHINSGKLIYSGHACFI
jgi:ABC-type multidrug transport system ATPase subunit